MTLRSHRLVTPGTILRWHRRLVRKKWTRAAGRTVEHERPTAEKQIGRRKPGLRSAPAWMTTACSHCRLCGRYRRAVRARGPGGRCAGSPR